MSHRHRALAVTTVLLFAFVASAHTSAQGGAPQEEPVTPTTITETPESRMLRVAILPSATRSMHGHPEMIWHIFATMDDPMELMIQGQAEPIRLGPWQSHFFIGGTVHAIRNPNPRPSQFLEVYAKKPEGAAAR